MDFVPNHVSNMHPYFIDARDNAQSKYREWYDIAHVLLMKRFYFQKDGNYLCFLDVKELPKLNLEFKECRDHVTNAALFWYEKIRENVIEKVRYWN